MVIFLLILILLCTPIGGLILWPLKMFLDFKMISRIQRDRESQEEKYKGKGVSK